MKKKVAGISILLLLLIFLFIEDRKNYPTEKKLKNETLTSTISPTPTPLNFVNFDFQDKSYLIYFTKLSGNQIKLVPNFSEKATGKTIIEKYKCKAAVSGGFYTKEGEPLGLFISEGRIFQEETQDKTSLLSGFFFVDHDGQAFINSQPSTKSPLILQSGPLILNNKRFEVITDEEARRIVLAEDNNGLIFALAIMRKEDFFGGPTLSELPEILFSAPLPFTLTKALNLDGGGASVYFGEDGASFAELSSIGSLICIY